MSHKWGGFKSGQDWAPNLQHLDTYRRADLHKARVKVLGAQQPEMFIHDLAALEIPMEEMDHHELRLGSDFKEILLHNFLIRA